MEKNKNKEKKEIPEGAPPFFKTWKGMYAFVLGTLVVLILLFYWFTKIVE